jgi:hypothetical protein
LLVVWRVRSSVPVIPDCPGGEPGVRAMISIGVVQIPDRSPFKSEK